MLTLGLDSTPFGLSAGHTRGRNVANAEGNEQGHAPLDAQTADKLLELLSTNDQFRELFTSDRQAALAQVGYPDAAEPSIQCTSVDQLASKEEIAQAREELKSVLTSQAALTVVHCFEADRVSDTFTKR